MVPSAFQAGYPNTTGFRKVVKATIMIKKKDGMSDDDFIAYYNNMHAQRAVPILQRHGIISYSLVMPPSPLFGTHQALNPGALSASRLPRVCLR
jgi:hypothetical protein